jgi:oxalate decarboxylase
MRELHWHPNASEWQFYIVGRGRMTVFAPVGSARTVDVKANDVGMLKLAVAKDIKRALDTMPVP